MHRKYRFTFLELVIACTIVAIMTALGGAVIYTFPRGYSEIEEQAARLDYLLRMDGYADNIVRNAVPLHWLDDNGAQKQVFCGDKDMLITASRNASAQSNGIIFSVMGKRKDQLVVQYRNSPLLYWTDDEEDIQPDTIREEIIATGVQELQIFYGKWENGTLQWLKDWDEADDANKNCIPPVIAWSITFEDNSVVHYIRRTCGNSYYTGFGRNYAEKN